MCCEIVVKSLPNATLCCKCVRMDSSNGGSRTALFSVTYFSNAFVGKRIEVYLYECQKCKRCQGQFRVDSGPLSHITEAEEDPPNPVSVS